MKCLDANEATVCGKNRMSLELLDIFYYFCIEIFCDDIIEFGKIRIYKWMDGSITLMKWNMKFLVNIELNMRDIVRFDCFCLETSYDNVDNEIWRLNF